MSFLSVHIRAADERFLSSLACSVEGGFFKVRNEEGSLAIQLRIREAYPKTYCYAGKDGSYVFGYGVSNGLDDEFLECTIWPDGRLDIRRDSFGTLPLFYGKDDKLFTLSNVYGDICKTLECTISERGILDALGAEAPMQTTYAEQVIVLWEDQFLRREADGHLVILEQASEQELPEIAPDNFNEFFSSYLDNFILTRLTDQSVAFEASGGLDSATLHQYYARKYPKNITWMASLLYRDEYQFSQEAKIKKLIDSTNSNFVYRLLDDPMVQFPLSRMITNDKYVPDYFEKTYFEPTLEYLKELAVAGVQVICTGVGGDELFSNIPQSQGVESKETLFRPASFTTVLFREKYIAKREGHKKQAVTRVSSASYASLCNNIYIEQGIWPVSPFLSSVLCQIVKQLPVHFRANKNILRAFHQAHGYIPEIYNPTQNEDFRPFFKTCFCAGVYDTVIQQIAKNAVSVRYGYVDTDILLKMYERTKSRYSERDAFDIYMWLTTEINLQSLK